MQELQRELEISPRLNHFTRGQRTGIVENWIRNGDLEKAEEFLVKNESNLERPWWLWSLVRKGQAKFKEASNLLRNHIKAPLLPKVSIEEISFDRLKRAFEISPGDMKNAAALILYYIERGDFQEVHEVTELIIVKVSEVPGYIKYWQAESLFRLEDYVQSWYAYERYLDYIAEKNSD